MKKNETGLTLVEVMVVTGIITFVLAIIAGVLYTGRRSWLTGDALLSVQQEARSGIDRMVRELRLAKSAVVGNDNRTVRFSVPFDANGDGFLDFIIGTNLIVYGADDPTDADQDGVYWESGWNIEYQIDTTNNQIIRKVLDGGGNPVSQSIIVRNINPNTAFSYFKTETGGTGQTTTAVSIGLTTQRSKIEGRDVSPALQITLVTTAKLRN